VDVALTSRPDQARAVTPAARPTLVCALAAEERAARKGGAPAARVGLRASLELPEGDLVAFGLAGALVPDLEAGDLLTATRLVDEDGQTLWAGEAVALPGAKPAVICVSRDVIDEPGARAALAARTGAVAVELESARLAASGRLTGIVRAISDTPGRRVGRLARAATPDGSTDWAVVVSALLTEPVRTLRAARDASRGLAALERAAASLAEASS
jgi:nucleoside phosphorylase